MKKYLFCASSIFVVLLSCANNANDINNSESIHMLKNFSVDSVSVLMNNSSNIGFSGIRNDSLFFLDDFYNYYYPVSIDGAVGKKQMGLGKGKGEIPFRNHCGVCYSEKKDILYFLEDADFLFEYDYKNNSLEKVTFSAEGAKESYDSPLSYTFWPEIIVCTDGRNIYYNNKGASEKVNPADSKYFEKAFLVSKCNLHNKKISLLGRYSDYYVKNKRKLWHLPLYYFDFSDDGSFELVFQADPQIYHCSPSGKVLFSYGTPGKDMNLKYSHCIHLPEAITAAFEKDIAECGTYYWIKKVGDYVFRSYTKSASSDCDGLQIYKGGKLIGDVEVPHNFRVIGNVGQDYVTQICTSEDEESAYFYRFRLDFE